MHGDVITAEKLSEKRINSQKIALKCCRKYRIAEKVILKNSYESSRSRIHSSSYSLSSGEKLISNAGENGNNSE